LADALSFTTNRQDANGSLVYLTNGTLQYIETGLAEMLSELAEKPPSCSGQSRSGLFRRDLLHRAIWSVFLFPVQGNECRTTDKQHGAPWLPEDRSVESASKSCAFHSDPHTSLRTIKASISRSPLPFPYSLPCRERARKRRELRIEQRSARWLVRLHNSIVLSSPRARGRFLKKTQLNGRCFAVSPLCDRCRRRVVQPAPGWTRAPSRLQPV
jgi:hypothetical protein